MRHLCNPLSDPQLVNSVDWSKWQVFLVDKRDVPKDHEDNFSIKELQFFFKIIIEDVKYL